MLYTILKVDDLEFKIKTRNYLYDFHTFEWLKSTLYLKN